MSDATVYRFYDADQRLLYVGVTGKKMDRFRSHSTTSVWWTDVAAIAVEHFAHAGEARQREKYLIEELNPLHNKLHRLPLPQAPMLPMDPTSGRAA